MIFDLIGPMSKNLCGVCVCVLNEIYLRVFLFCGHGSYVTFFPYVTSHISNIVYFISAEEVGRAEFNVATPTYATVAYSVR